MGNIGRVQREVQFEPAESPVDDESTSGLPWEALFAANVRRIREMAGVSQTELAKRAAARGLPFHQQTVQRVEAGARPIRLNEACILSSLLGADLEAMITPVDAGTAAAALRQRQHAAEEAQRQAIATLTAVAEEVERAQSDLVQAADAYRASAAADEVSALELVGTGGVGTASFEALPRLAAACRQVLSEVEHG